MISTFNRFHEYIFHLAQTPLCLLRSTGVCATSTFWWKELSLPEDASSCHHRLRMQSGPCSDVRKPRDDSKTSYSSQEINGTAFWNDALKNQLPLSLWPLFLINENILGKCLCSQTFWGRLTRLSQLDVRTLFVHFFPPSHIGKGRAVNLQLGPRRVFFFFFWWIGFWLSRHQFLQGVKFFETNRAMLRIEQNLPARSRKRGEAPIARVGKGLPGFGIERAPSREGVNALDHQATPAASQDESILNHSSSAALSEVYPDR